MTNIGERSFAVADVGDFEDVTIGWPIAWLVFVCN
jgi:hypothetical protein